jgi:hypothetical protein
VSEPEVLVTISMRFPPLDRVALSDHIADVVKAAIASGGLGTHVTVQGFDPDEDEEAG